MLKVCSEAGRIWLSGLIQLYVRQKWINEHVPEVYVAQVEGARDSCKNDSYLT